MAGLNYEPLDEDEFDKQPDRNISDRIENYDPLDDLDPVAGEIDMGGSGKPSLVPSKPSPIVKAAIAKKMAPPAPVVESDDDSPIAEKDPNDISQDPLMLQYAEKQKDLDNFRAMQAAQNFNSNVGQAAAIAAQGANAPTPDTPLFKNMQEQSKEGLKSQEEDQLRRQQVVNAIEARKSRESIASSNLDLKKAILGQTNAFRQGTADARNSRLDSLNIGRANALMSDANIKRETTKLDATRSAQSMLDAVRDGSLTDSKNIRNQLSNIITTIELGSPGGQGDRQAMGIDNLYTRAKDMMSFITSNPNKSIPPAYLDQLESETHALGDRAAMNYKALTDSKLATSDLSGGDPDVDPGQVHRLVSQGASKFLQSNGYDPQTGKSTRKPKETAFPKQIKLGDQIATVNSPEEYREAQSEGWQ